MTITGSAYATNFNYYKVEYTTNTDPRNARDEEWTSIVDNKTPSVRSGALAQWDTTTMPNGRYALRLAVLDVSGQYGNRCVVKDIIVFNSMRTP